VWTSLENVFEPCDVCGIGVINIKLFSPAGKMDLEVGFFQGRLWLPVFFVVCVGYKSNLLTICFLVVELHG